MLRRHQLVGKPRISSGAR